MADGQSGFFLVGRHSDSFLAELAFQLARHSNFFNWTGIPTVRRNAKLRLTTNSVNSNH